MANVFVNWNRKTCIVYSTADGLVQAVVMDAPELGLLEMGYEQFHSEWTEIEADDKRAASQYLAGLIPFNLEVQTILENIIMPTKKPAATKTAKAAPAADAATPKKSAAAAKKEAADAKAAEFFGKQEGKLKAKAAAEGAPEPEGKPAKEPKPPKEAKEKAPRVPKEDITGKKIVLLPAAEGKRFQEGSVRSQVFALIKSGMTVKSLLAAVAKKELCEEKVAIDCLNKLRDTNQKTPTVTLE